MKIETIIDIDKPPSEVFDFLTDEENLTLWVTNFIKMEHLSGEDGTVGSTYLHVYNEKDNVVHAVEEITARKENELLESTLRYPRMNMHIKSELIPRGTNGTVMKATVDYKPRVPLASLILMLSKRKLKKRQKKDLGKLKSLVEKL